MKKIIQKFANCMGYKIIHKHPKDFDKEFLEIYEKCKNYTMTTIERMYSLYIAVKYIIDSNIKGDLVECGVWKGGSTMLIAKTLIKNKQSHRKIYLYDTYAGMTKPTDKDQTFYDGGKTKETWHNLQNRDYNAWCYASLEEVKKNMFSTNYPKENLIFVKGKVEETIPKIIPKKISLLRLDTDFFESTYHELKYLFPLLSIKGLLLLDDYGYWKGMREAVDKYFKENKIKMFLSRIDQKGRIGIK